MMPIYLEQRFHLLMEFAKDTKNLNVARENLAAAKELVDTAHMLEDIDSAEYRYYRSLCIHAQISVAGDEIERARSAVPKTYEKFSDGVRAVRGQP